VLNLYLLSLSEYIYRIYTVIRTWQWFLVVWTILYINQYSRMLYNFIAYSRSMSIKATKIIDKYKIFQTISNSIFLSDLEKVTTSSNHYQLFGHYRSLSHHQPLSHRSWSIIQPSSISMTHSLLYTPTKLSISVGNFLESHSPKIYKMRSSWQTGVGQLNRIP
jgi:hypothetical protein